MVKDQINLLFHMVQEPSEAGVAKPSDCWEMLEFHSYTVHLASCIPASIIARTHSTVQGYKDTFSWLGVTFSGKWKIPISA